MSTGVGQTALSNAAPASTPAHVVERWCNQVAAELLVPAAAIVSDYRPGTVLSDECRRLVRVFKVSTLVVLRRPLDVGVLGRDEMWTAYHDELDRLCALPRSSGGEVYLTQPARVSKRFAHALIGQTLEGHTLYRDAFRLLGISKVETLRELGRNLQVVA